MYSFVLRRELPFSVIRLYRKWLWYDLSMAVAVRSWYSEKNHIHFSVNHLFWLPKPFMFGAATEMISGRVRICGKFSQELSANSSWNGFKWIEDDMNMKHTPIAFELVKRELNIFEMRSLNVETVSMLMDYDHYDQLQENELLFALAISGNGVKWYLNLTHVISAKFIEFLAMREFTCQSKPRMNAIALFEGAALFRIVYLTLLTQLKRYRCAFHFNYLFKSVWIFY